MSILFLIGLFHQAFLWSGDILATYAVLGVLLLLFRARRARVLVRAAGLVLATPTLALTALVGWASWLAPAAAGARVALLVSELRYPMRQAFFAFAMLLLGFAAGRARGEADDPLLGLRRQLPLLSAVGIAGSLAFVALDGRAGARVLSWTAVLAESLIALAAPALALAYAALLLRALERPRWQRALAPLAAAGRLSLTNYLLQSLIGGVLLARLGAIHPPVGIAIACAIFALQVAASGWWLAYFRFGPVEWLWRALSYGKPPPMRV
jgi:uncharacterized protein